MVVWWNYLTYSSIGIRQRRQSNSASYTGAKVIQFCPAEGPTITHELESWTSDVVFYIRCGHKYEFGFQELLSPDGDQENENDTAQIQWLGQVSNEVMTRSPPVGLAFAGMMVGLYAFSDYQQSINPADFHFMQCQQLD